MIRTIFTATGFLVMLLVACEKDPISSDPPNTPVTPRGTLTQELTIMDDFGEETLVFHSGSNIHARLAIENSCSDTVIMWRIWDQTGLSPTCDAALVDYDTPITEYIGPLPTTGVFLLLPDSAWVFETIFTNTAPGEYRLAAELNFACCAVIPDAELVHEVDWNSKIIVLE